MTRRWRIADTDWNHWPDGLSDEELWPTVAAQRLDGIEIGVYSVDDELADDRIRLFETLAARYQLPVVAILLSLPSTRWPGGALTTAPGAVAEQVLGCAQACRRLNLTTLGIWPGADLPTASYPSLVTGLLRAREVAADQGVRIAVEYKPGTIIPDCAAALDLLVDVPGTGALLDFGHAHAAGEDPADVIHKLGDKLWHVHLGDAAAGQEDDDLPLGRIHDARPALAALDSAGFDGVASFDLYGAVCSGRWTGRQAVEASLYHIRGKQ